MFLRESLRLTPDNTHTLCPISLFNPLFNYTITVKMKFSLVVAALAATSAAAFAPSAGERASTSLNMDRRAALGQFGVAAAVVATGLPQVANADGAVSSASKNRARGTYGERIAGLKSAVDSGDFAAVAAEKTAFVLFNSGVYPTTKEKASKQAAIAGTNKIFAAIKAKDAGALKSAYADYVATNAITALPAVDPNSGQGYSNDFDFRTRTRAGAIYVR